MRPASAAFLAALTRSHTLATRADLLIGGITRQQGLALAGGSVTLDRTAEIRGRCDITLADPTLIPKTAFDSVTPFGAELQLWRGIALSTGPELVSLGIFGLQDLTTDPTGASMAITGLDRAQRVKEADFEAPEVVAAGTNYADAIRNLIAAGVPGLTYRFVGTAEATPLLVYADDSAGGRWSAAQSMATSIGCDLYFDGDGVCVLEPIPDPSTQPVATLSDGPDGVVVSLAKTWNRDPAYNAVIAYSSNPGDPIRAIARDLDPTSPTYYFGPFGKKPLRYSAPFTSESQAQTAADGLLRQGLGVSQSLDLSVIPNPALEPGDIVAVSRQKLGVDEVDVLDSVTIGLSVDDAMTAGVRARQIAA